MAEQPPVTDPTGASNRYPGTPRWVKILGVVAVIVVLLVAFALITGLGGPHGPQRHGGSLERTFAISVTA